MINLEEMKRFKQLEEDPFVRKLNRFNSVFAWTKVKLKDGQEIPVSYWREDAPHIIYTYYLTLWGVLKYLGRGNYDKSPLCTTLDEEMCRLFDQFLERNNLNERRAGV